MSASTPFTLWRGQSRPGLPHEEEEEDDDDDAEDEEDKDEEEEDGEDILSPLLPPLQ